VYEQMGRFADAEPLFRRALAIREQALGPDHPQVATTLSQLSSLLMSQRNYAESEASAQRALSIREQALGTNNDRVAGTLINLGEAQLALGRYAEAEATLRRAVEIRQSMLPADDLSIARTQAALARVYHAQGHFAQAEPLFKRDAAANEEMSGSHHPDTAAALHRVATVTATMGKTEDALSYSRRATAAVIAHAAAEAGTGGQTQGGLVERRAEYFRRHVANLFAASRKQLESNASLSREAFVMAQWAGHSAAATAIQQMAVRFASAQGPLAEVVRKKQDLAAAWHAANQRLLAALSGTGGMVDKSALDAIRRDLAALERDLAAINQQLDKEFPDYAALASPKPLPLDAVQKLLGPDEALVFLLPGDRVTYLFAVSSTERYWKDIGIGEKDLGAKVAAFRRGLDVSDLQAALDAGRADLFDLAFAHDLYQLLLGQLDPLIKDKRHLLVVPSGVLTGLPFHLLVTEKPALPAADTTDLGAYRDAAWLIKRQAVSVLPSVASLQSLRVLAGKIEAKRPLIGFGDPVFRPDAPPAPPDPGVQRGAPGRTETKPARNEKRRVAKTRGYADYWRGADADPTMLGQSLPPLPDTADELKAVAKKLNAAPADLLLGRAATESAVKRTQLVDYRIIYFATHGLVAGDIKGLAEPSLALTPPRQPDAQDDGLLTASEVAQLRLNADWVVLSACNTAAGDTPGAEALSGLARAFFYAGARALLVSHWAVDSAAAARLTTATFDHLGAAPGIGRAEALRRAMLAYLADRSDPQNGYPAYWAPFSLIGEGTAR
jgi:CHAT domain-containing protein